MAVRNGYFLTIKGNPNSTNVYSPLQTEGFTTYKISTTCIYLPLDDRLLVLGPFPSRICLFGRAFSEK